MRLPFKKKHFAFLTLAAAMLLFSQCASKDKKTADAPTAEADSEGGSQSSPVRPTALSRAAAAARSQMVSHVAYSLWFGLDAVNEDYEGRAVIRFDLKPQAKDHGKELLIDLEEGSLSSLTVNGQSLIARGADPKEVAKRFDGHHVSLQLSELQAGNNRVEIAFTHPYSRNGAGLHRFKDPVDSSVYLYTDFEPYDAHRAFPCFDQPDLKASYELTVEAPEDWQVISNTLERDVTKVDGRRSWQFPPSPVFSTYLVALHAGPYVSWKKDAGGIPTRLFARKSLKQYVDHDEWLKITAQGLDWFSIYFGYPYPFSKYDQIIVPDFNSGAMENVGAVTFNERYIYRTKVTVDRRRQRADTILHEMAHMWFGDLVTMRWWNGLWLNESFATFMAAKAVNEATTFKGSWEDFFGDKEWAYWEDQLVTTHPIEVPVFDTDKASSIFDGISYGKGAASLKQLAFLLGEDDFREGLQRYFQKFAFRNTTLADFIKSLSEASGKDLNKWQKTWLLTSGVDPVSVEWRCSSSGKLDHMSLNYGKRDDRQHRTIVGLYRMKNGKLRSDRSITVLSDVNPKIYSEGKLLEQDSRGAGATTTEIPCPDFVYPNQGDYDYAKVDLDPISTKTAHESLSKFEDAFLRRMVWHDLWQMVVDSKLRAQDYADIVLKHIPKETDTKVLGHVLSTITDPFGDSLLRYLAPELRNEVRAKAEEVVRKQLLVAQGGSDAQLVWFKAFYETAHAPESMELVRKLLSGKAKLNKLTMDQEHRWDLIQALAREGGKEAADLIAADLKKDDTDMGQKAAIMAQVQIPTSENKAAWLAKITKRELPYPKLKEAMRKYHIMGQEALSQAAVDAYFEMIPKLRTLEDQEFAKRFAGAMYPDLCDSAIVQKTTEVLNANGDLPTTIAKALKVGRQEQERCVLARAKSASSG